MKEKMITRTITTTAVETLCMNTTTCEVTVEYYQIPGVCDKALALKTVKSKYDTEEFVCVAVRSLYTVETLYGVTESEFMAIARKLPPRGAKEDAEG